MHLPAPVLALLCELAGDRTLSAREAARRVVAQHGPGRGGTIDNAARHLLRLAERELRRPGPLVVEILCVWERVTREGARLRRHARERRALRQAKTRAAIRAFGGIYLAWRRDLPNAARWRPPCHRAAR